MGKKIYLVGVVAALLSIGACSVQSSASHSYLSAVHTDLRLTDKTDHELVGAGYALCGLWGSHSTDRMNELLDQLSASGFSLNDLDNMNRSAIAWFCPSKSNYRNIFEY